MGQYPPPCHCTLLVCEMGIHPGCVALHQRSSGHGSEWRRIRGRISGLFKVGSGACRDKWRASSAMVVRELQRRYEYLTRRHSRAARKRVKLRLLLPWRLPPHFLRTRVCLRCLNSALSIGLPKVISAWGRRGCHHASTGVVRNHDGVAGHSSGIRESARGADTATSWQPRAGLHECHAGR